MTTPCDTYNSLLVTIVDVKVMKYHIILFMVLTEEYTLNTYYCILNYIYLFLCNKL